MESSSEQLIEIVKNYPVLYDLSHPEYKNTKKKDKIWDEIASKFAEGNGEKTLIFVLLFINLSQMLKRNNKCIHSFS